MKALTSALQTAGKRLQLSDALVATACAQSWTWEAITPDTVKGSFEYFNSLSLVINEGQRVAAYERSQGGDARTYAILERQLSSTYQQLSQAFRSRLAHAQDPLGVLTMLHRHPELRATSACVSALLGLRDEREGGDEDRHSVTERASFYARGGYMYQASDLYELWPIYSALQFKEGVTFYDLGSGYGHALFCGAVVRRDVTFKGIELMPIRVAECNNAKDRLKLANISFREGDVATGGFSDADVIFLFNPFPPDTQVEVVDVLQQLVLSKPLVIIDYGGFVTQRLTNVVPIVGADLAPYRLVASKKFLQASCDLVGMPVP